MTIADIRKLPSQNRLNEVLHYDEISGDMIWLERPESEFPNYLQYRAWNGHYAGKLAGSNYRGYRYITLNDDKWAAHRIAWTMVFGEIPEGMLIDHINGDGLDNRIANLRLATNSENQRNQKPKAGTRGVYYRKRLDAYVASYRQDGRLVHLGTYKNQADAVSAAKAARSSLGYTNRHLG